MQAQIEQVRSMLSHRLHKEEKFMKWMNKVDKDHNETLCVEEWGKLLKRIKNHEAPRSKRTGLTHRQIRSTTSFKNHEAPWELTSEVTTLSFQQILLLERTADSNEITYSGLKEWLTLDFLKTVFKRFDKDNDQCLDATEVRDALAYLDCAMNAEEFDTFFNKCDKNKDGTLSYKEFKKSLYLRLVYENLDTDSNGSLNIEEVRDSFQIIIDITLSDEEFKNIYSLLDCNEDGSVSYKEFKKYFKDSKKIKKNILANRGDGDGTDELIDGTNRTLIHPQQQQQQPSPTDMSRGEQSPSGPEHLPASPSTPLWWKCSQCEYLNGDNVGHLTRCQSCDHKFSVADDNRPVTSKRNNGTRTTNTRRSEARPDALCCC